MVALFALDCHVNYGSIILSRNFANLYISNPNVLHVYNLKVFTDNSKEKMSNIGADHMKRVMCVFV